MTLRRCAAIVCLASFPTSQFGVAGPQGQGQVQGPQRMASQTQEGRFSSGFQPVSQLAMQRVCARSASCAGSAVGAGFVPKTLVLRSTTEGIRFAHPGGTVQNRL